MAAGHVPVTLGSSGSRCADVDGFLVALVRFPPLTKLPLHTHERATVAVILRGSFDGLMRHASHPCPASTVLTEPPGELHGNLFQRAGADVLTVQPDPGRVELLESFAGVLGEVNLMRDLGVASVARRAAAELRMPDGVTPFAVEGLVLELLALAAPAAEDRCHRQRRSGCWHFWSSEASAMRLPPTTSTLRRAGTAESPDSPGRSTT